jgi:hypothetical protein
MVMGYFGGPIFEPLNDHLTFVQVLFWEDVTPYNYVFLKTFSMV